MAAAALVLVLGGCGTADSSPGQHVAPEYVAQMKEALAARLHPSAFEKKAFADFYVSEQEYKEAQQLYTKCMAGKGWIIDHWTPSGQSRLSAAPNNPDQDLDSQQIDRDNRVCAMGTLVPAQSIYLGEKWNPRALTTDQLIRACYKRHDVPDGLGLSDSAFSKLVDDSAYRPSSPVGDMCFLDPDGSVGFTPAQAAKEMKSYSGGSTTPLSGQ